MQTQMRLSDKVVYRYVPHENVDQYRKFGWVFQCDIKGHHGQYAVIMKKVKDDKKNS
jgi:hypothetical protein